MLHFYFWYLFVPDDLTVFQFLLNASHLLLNIYGSLGLVLTAHAFLEFNEHLLRNMQIFFLSLGNISRLLRLLSEILGAIGESNGFGDAEVGCEVGGVPTQ